MSDKKKISSEGLRPNQLSWEERHPSNYKFTPIDVDQFLPKKEKVMSDKQPTEKEIKEFWVKCGFGFYGRYYMTSNLAKEELKTKSLESFRRLKHEVEGDCICPQCGAKTILPSGFSGNPFCWGICYHYFRWKDIITPPIKEVLHDK